jgi:hypothetical protein
MMQLLPFLERTVALTFSTTKESGGFHVGYSLRTFATVQRSKSPIFRFFDDFPDRCRATELRTLVVHPTFWLVRTCPESFSTCEGFDFDRNVVKRELREGYKLLLTESSSGRGKLTDRDESGWTLLHVSITRTRR